MLRERGFYRGEPDGVLGSATTQALIVFQRREGLQANGRIDTRTATALGVSNRSGQQGNQNEPATTGQSGNSAPQSPANENAGRGGQPSARQNNSNAMPQNNSEKQQPANQNAGAEQKNNSAEISPPPPGRATARSSLRPSRAAAAITAVSPPTRSRNEATEQLKQVMARMPALNSAPLRRGFSWATRCWLPVASLIIGRSDAFAEWSSAADATPPELR